MSKNRVEFCLDNKTDVPIHMTIGNTESKVILAAQCSIQVVLDGKQRIHVFTVYRKPKGWIAYGDKVQWESIVTTIVDQIQPISGTLTVSTKELEMFKPLFVADDTESTEYNDEQYRRVGKFYADLKASAETKLHAHNALGHGYKLVRQGVLTSKQLKAIVEEMF